MFGKLNRGAPRSLVAGTVFDLASVRGQGRECMPEWGWTWWLYFATVYFCFSLIDDNLGIAAERVANCWCASQGLPKLTHLINWVLRLSLSHCVKFSGLVRRGRASKEISQMKGDNCVGELEPRHLFLCPVASHFGSKADWTKASAAVRTRLNVWNCYRDTSCVSTLLSV